MTNPAEPDAWRIGQRFLVNDRYRDIKSLTRAQRQMTLGWSVMTLGAVLLTVAAFGVLRLPGALTRQHAATKASTLALSLMIAGVAVLHPGWWLRLAILAIALMLTVPIASHALARAAASKACARAMQN